VRFHTAARALRYLAIGWEEPVDEDWKPEPAEIRFNPFTYGKF